MTEIRTPTVEDAPPIASCWVKLARGQRSHGSHVQAEPNREAILQAITRHIVADELRVATVEDEIVGFVMIGFETGEYELDCRRGTIQNLFVEPDHRNRGLGSGLLEAAEQMLAERGADVVSLEVLAPNERARRFYRRHGYDPHRIELTKQLENDTP
jgi:ribosomal protein S18 acetylase RimI-like enzyme